MSPAGWIPLAGLIALAVSACANPVDRQVQAYKDSRLSSELSDYEAAQSQGHLLDACTRAGQIAAAYRETGSPNAVAWNAKRKEDCQAAMRSLTSRLEDAPPDDDETAPAPAVTAKR